MIRNLKAVGLAFVAVFALSAMAASAAQAGEFMTEGNTEIVASGHSLQKFHTTSGNVECNVVSGNATSFNEKEVTGENIEYTYENEKGEVSNNCPSVLGTTATINTAGCHYTFTPGETVDPESTDKTKGTVKISSCTAGGIIVKATGCTITVPNGQTVGPVYYTNTTEAEPMDVDIEAAVGDEKDAENHVVNGIEYTHEGFLCGTGTGTEGEYHGTVTASGDGANGITVT